MSTLKKVLLAILGLLFLVGCFYALQPVKMEIIPAIFYKIEQTGVNEWNFLFSLSLKSPDGYYRPWVATFKYPEANNWSYRNRKKLPFPENTQCYTVYFGKNLPQPDVWAKIYWAKIYRLKNTWTGNYTRDCLVAHVLSDKK